MKFSNGPIPNLMIVILNVNLKDDTIDLIKSIIKAGATPEQIILVDNGSSDGSVEAIKGIYGRYIQILENQENIGFAAGNNQGFEVAYQSGAKWVLILNNDTLVAEDFFSQIEHVLTNNEDYAILAPAIYYYSDPEILWNMGAFAIPGTLLARNRYQGHPRPDNMPKLLPVDYISGCAMLIRSEVYRDIKLFDPRFFIYWEDVDLCARARRAGFKIAVITNGKMWHKVSKTMHKDKPQQRYLYTRNMIFYSRKNAIGLQHPIMAGYLIFRLLFTIVKDLTSDQKDLIRPLLKGWRDGWRDPISK